MQNCTNVESAPLWFRGFPTTRATVVFCWRYRDRIPACPAEAGLGMWFPAHLLLREEIEDAKCPGSGIHIVHNDQHWLGKTEEAAAHVDRVESGRVDQFDAGRTETE
jgi:hypothetical protein